jgi:hypothetical protein
MALEPFVEPRPLLLFRNLLYTDGRAPWTSFSPCQDHYLHTGLHKQNKHTCRWVAFNPTIPAFERAKTVHASDREATVLGNQGTMWAVIILIWRVCSYGRLQSLSNVKWTSEHSVICSLLTLNRLDKCIYQFQTEQVIPARPICIHQGYYPS